MLNHWLLNLQDIMDYFYMMEHELRLKSFLIHHLNHHQNNNTVLHLYRLYLVFLVLLAVLLDLLNLFHHDHL